MFLVILLCFCLGLTIQIYVLQYIQSYMVHGVSLYFKQLMQMHNTFKIIIGIVDIITDEIHDENILLGFGVCEGGGGVVVKIFLRIFF